MIDSANLFLPLRGKIAISPANLAPSLPKGSGRWRWGRVYCALPLRRAREPYFTVFVRAPISHFLFICFSQINIDYNTRMAIQRGVAKPTKGCFEAAQQQVYSLMKKDSYPRFLLSDTYLHLTRRKGPGVNMFRRRSRSCVFNERGEADGSAAAAAW